MPATKHRRRGKARPRHQMLHLAMPPRHRITEEDRREDALLEERLHQLFGPPATIHQGRRHRLGLRAVPAGARPARGRGRDPLHQRNGRLIRQNAPKAPSRDRLIALNDNSATRSRMGVRARQARSVGRCADLHSSCRCGDHRAFPRAVSAWALMRQLGVSRIDQEWT